MLDKSLKTIAVLLAVSVLAAAEGLLMDFL